jgi:hypothetical protein
MKTTPFPSLRMAVLLLAIGAFALLAFTSQDDKYLARVTPVNGVLVFTDCEPVAKYKVIGQIKDPALVMSGSQNYYPYRRDARIKELRKAYPEADGFISRHTNKGLDYADVIQFVE